MNHAEIFGESGNLGQPECRTSIESGIGYRRKMRGILQKGLSNEQEKGKVIDTDCCIYDTDCCLYVACPRPRSGGDIADTKDFGSCMEGETDIECGHCGVTFIVRREVHIRYSTRKLLSRK